MNAEVQARANNLMAKRRLLTARRDEAVQHANDLVERAKVKGLDPLAGTSDADRAAADEIERAYQTADAIADERDRVTDELHRLLDAQAGSAGSVSNARAWAVEVASRLTAGGNFRASIGTPLEVPSVVEPGVVAFPENPDRLIDLLVERRPLDGNTFEYLRQTVRTNNAAPVADHGTKPTSVFTVTPVEDRARVVAHLSEPIPLRYFDDEAELTAWLEAEMHTGVLDGLEQQIVNGDGQDEAYAGILNTAGTVEIPFTTDPLTTLRSARTALAVLKEQPTAWVLNPLDLETIDLLREETDGQFLVGGGLANIFGDLPRVSSTSVPAGTALLGDWRQTRLYVRHGVMIAADSSGERFAKNEVVVRAEGRFGFAVLRPQAVAVVHVSDQS